MAQLEGQVGITDIVDSNPIIRCWIQFVSFDFKSMLLFAVEESASVARQCIMNIVTTYILY